VRTKPILLGAAVILFAVILIARFTRPSSPPIAAHIVWNVRSSNMTIVKLAITNGTTDSCVFGPFEVQVRTTNGWMKLQGSGDDSPSRLLNVEPMGIEYCTIQFTNLPAGDSARFEIKARPRLAGLIGLFGRLRLKYMSHPPPGSFSVNAVNKKITAFGYQIDVVSDEFVAPGTVK
jgi:hypothetical protein